MDRVAVPGSAKRAERSAPPVKPREEREDLDGGLASAALIARDGQLGTPPDALSGSGAPRGGTAFGSLQRAIDQRARRPALSGASYLFGSQSMMLGLQRSMGNHAVQRIIAESQRRSGQAVSVAVQRAATEPMPVVPTAVAETIADPSVVQRVPKPKATSKQGKLKDKLEGFIVKNKMDEALQSAEALVGPYWNQLLLYKLDKHAGTDNVKWTKYFAIGNRAQGGPTLKYDDLLAYGDVSWVKGAAVAFFNTFVDRAGDARKTIIQFIDAQPKDVKLRLLKDPQLSYNLGGEKSGEYLKSLAKTWPEVASDEQKLKGQAIEDQILGKNYRAAKALIGQFDAVRQLYLYKKSTVDDDLWSQYLLSLPAIQSATMPDINYIGDQLRTASYAWIKTKADADYVMEHLESDLQSNSQLNVLKNANLRMRLRQQSPDAYEDFEKARPALRIAASVEERIAGDEVDATNVDDVVQAVFDAFLGDLPISGLIYSTNMRNFKVPEFLLGKLPQTDTAAPCMALSGVFNQLLPMILPNPPEVRRGEDDQPLLTAPLKTLGKGGILTRETTFVGNVYQYEDKKGYKTVNRIFFGDGHIWLQINGRDYDPTLGMSGPAGLVQSGIDRHFAKTGADSFEDGKTKLTRTTSKPLPPDGVKLFFEKRITIKTEA